MIVNRGYWKAISVQVTKDTKMIDQSTTDQISCSYWKAIILERLLLRMIDKALEVVDKIVLVLMVV